MWLAKLIEGQILAAERIELSTRVVIAKLVRALAFFLAILVALPIVGIDVTALSVFGGALGVGLAFGLQKIASNYVSGYIILLDRSVRIGDLVTVDNRHGVVKEIASRYTVIRSLDGTESIIPNETLITQAVTNHSFTDRKVVVEAEGHGRLRLRRGPRLRAAAGHPRGASRASSRTRHPGPGSPRSATTASTSS